MSFSSRYFAFQYQESPPTARLPPDRPWRVGWAGGSWRSQGAPMRNLILAIDQGKTGTTALLVDEGLAVVGRATVEFPNYYPTPGQVEHDADEIWASVGTAVQRALAVAGAAGADIRAIGVTNQRETSLFWSRSTGRPIGRA